MGQPSDLAKNVSKALHFHNIMITLPPSCLVSKAQAFHISHYCKIAVSWIVREFNHELSVSHHLLTAGLRHLIFEKDSTGYAEYSFF